MNTAETTEDSLVWDVISEIGRDTEACAGFAGDFVDFKCAPFSVSLQESLRKITHTLALKNEEISNFVCTLKQSLENLEVQPLFPAL